MSDQRADQIRHWLSVADDQDNDEKKLAARYTAAASARRWVLHELGNDSDDSTDVPDGWAQVGELDDQADTYLDDDRQDEAMFRRAQANLLALRLFEDSDEPQRPDGKAADDDADDSDEDDDDKKDDDHKEDDDDKDAKGDKDGDDS